MNISNKRKLLFAQLNEHLAFLNKSVTALEYSYDKCSAIGEKKEYNLEEQESFEALTSRFARSSDILTQKVFKTLFILLQEDVKTIIDAANFLEKLKIVDNADDLLNIREIRNQITHEYVESDLKTLFLDVLRYVPELRKIISKVRAYYQKTFAQLKKNNKIELFQGYIPKGTGNTPAHNKRTFRLKHETPNPRPPRLSTPGDHLSAHKPQTQDKKVSRTHLKYCN